MSTVLFSSRRRIFLTRVLKGCTEFTYSRCGEVLQILPDTDRVRVRTEFSDRMMCRAGGNAAAAPGEKVFASIRPEDVDVLVDPPSDGENTFKGTIVNEAYLGNFLYFFVSVDGTMIRVQAPHHLPLEEGQDLYLYLNPQKCMLLA